MRAERLAQSIHRRDQLIGVDIVALVREPARRAQHVLPAQLGRRRPAGEPDDLLTAGSRARAMSTLVPTFPVAPVTTTRMSRACPGR
jgi:hypothetical protein